jgi:transglutaminase-like putative cysteine protease
VPSRQVAGWLYDECGHVWAEVLVPDEGWRQFDPTAGLECGSEYVPYLATEQGELPMVYLSDVRVDVK